MIKKHQKITKFKQKNVILMSEKVSVILINKGFYWKYGVEVVYPLKQGLKPKSTFIFSTSLNLLK